MVWTYFVLFLISFVGFWGIVGNFISLPAGLISLLGTFGVATIKLVLWVAKILFFGQFCFKAIEQEHKSE